MKIGKKERASQNGREQGEWGKMSKGAGSIYRSPLTEPRLGSYHFLPGGGQIFFGWSEGDFFFKGPKEVGKYF